VSTREQLPRIGVGLPHCGPHASPDGIVAVAKAAERLGFHSVWTFERLLRPIGPDGENSYGLPPTNASVYDPLETLTWVAAHTERVRLGTSVLDALFHPPVILARRLATLDQLSGGRVVAGLGQGWMPEEFATVGVPLTRRGDNFEDYLAALRACWKPDPVEYDGRRYQIPRSEIGPKTVNGGIPILIGANAESATERAAHVGDGFAAVFLGWEATLAQVECYRNAGGSGPIVLRVNPERIDGDDTPFAIRSSSVIDDLMRAARAGIDEVFFDLTHAGLGPDRQIEAFNAFTALVRTPTNAG
jgi:probable F420-dependent oxidoreductase